MPGRREMNCTEFSRWLDLGMPATAAKAAGIHAGICSSCARMWEAERSLDSLLREESEALPRHFVDNVMRRIAADQPWPGPVAPLQQDPELPWWIRALAEPTTALAFVVVAFLIAWGEKLWSRLPSIASGLARNIETGALARFLREWTALHSMTASALVVPFFLMIVILSIGLYRGMMRLTST
jgi:hypothetical protein